MPVLKLLLASVGLLLVVSSAADAARYHHRNHHPYRRAPVYGYYTGPIHYGYGPGAGTAAAAHFQDTFRNTY